MTSIPGYCIPRGIRIQKLSISPYFYPQTAKKWAWIGVFRAKRAKHSKRLMRLQPYFAQWQRLSNSRCGSSQKCPTNPKWQSAAILKKWIHCYISATAWPIYTKFSVLTRTGPLNSKKFSKIHLKNPRLRTVVWMDAEQQNGRHFEKKR